MIQRPDFYFFTHYHFKPEATTFAMKKKDEDETRKLIMLCTSWAKINMAIHSRVSVQEEKPAHKHHSINGYAERRNEGHACCILCLALTSISLTLGKRHLIECGDSK